MAATWTLRPEQIAQAECILADGKGALSRRVPPSNVRSGRLAGEPKPRPQAGWGRLAKADALGRMKAGRCSKRKRRLALP